MQEWQIAGGTVANVNGRENHKWHTGSNPVLTTNTVKCKSVIKTMDWKKMGFKTEEEYKKFLKEKWENLLQ
ncbi:hypothetical protein EBZ38_15930, partial [bacterium]|nr:hypothetical protein [bacterium]